MYLVIKMFKKLVSVVLAILIILICSFVVFADEPVTLSISNETVYAGDEFVLNLLISDNSKMSAAVIDVSYDKTKLQFVSAENGSILNENANITIRNIDGENAKVRFTYLDPSSSVTSAGIIAKLKFKALDNADGKTDLRISVPNAADFVTQDLEHISYKIENSTIEIINESIVDSKTEIATETETAKESIVESQTEEDKTELISEENEKNTDKTNNASYVVPIIFVGALIIGGALFVVIKTKRRGNK